MKTMIEHMTTMIILSIMLFVFAGVIGIETQVINARNYHTKMIEALQNKDDYSASYIESLNSKYSDSGFDLSIDDNGDILVEYNYDIQVPLLGTISENRIVGWAR